MWWFMSPLRILCSSQTKVSPRASSCARYQAKRRASSRSWQVLLVLLSCCQVAAARLLSPASQAHSIAFSRHLTCRSRRTRHSHARTRTIWRRPTMDQQVRRHGPTTSPICLLYSHAGPVCSFERAQASRNLPVPPTLLRQDQLCRHGSFVDHRRRSRVEPCRAGETRPQERRQRRVCAPTCCCCCCCVARTRRQNSLANLMSAESHTSPPSTATWLFRMIFEALRCVPSRSVGCTLFVSLRIRTMLRRPWSTSTSIPTTMPRHSSSSRPLNSLSSSTRPLCERSVRRATSKPPPRPSALRRYCRSASWRPSCSRLVSVTLGLLLAMCRMKWLNEGMNECCATKRRFQSVQ